MDSGFKFNNMMFSNKDPEYEKELVNIFQNKLPGHKKAFRQLQQMYEQPINKMISSAMPKSGDVSKAQLLAVAANKFPEVIQKFDPAQGRSVFQWVNNNLRGHLGNVVREDVTGVFVPRTERDSLHRFTQARFEAIRNYGNNPTDEQIFEFYPEGYAREDFERGKRYFKIDLVSDSVTMKDDEGHGVTLADMYTGQSAFMDSKEQFFQDKTEQLLELMKHKLSFEEYKVLNDYLIKRKSMAQAALDNGISTTKLRSIESKWNEIVSKEGGFML